MISNIKRVFFCLIILGCCPGFAAAAEPENKGFDTETPPSSVEQASPVPIFTPKEPIQIRVNVPATRLDLYVNGQLKKSYRVAVGMPKYPTPIRDLNISYIVWNPWWIPPPDSEWAKDAQKTPPGPGNPLGPVKMMMEEGVRIHGTNAPGSIGRAASHACMRMKSAEAKELAWEIQQRYSEKNTSELLETYQKNSRSSYWVKMGQEVPVSIEYKLVETNGDKFLIHPDRYGKGGLQSELEAALGSNSGIVVDKAFLKKLAKKRGSGSLEITLQELKDLQNATPEGAPLNTSTKPSSNAQPLNSGAKRNEAPPTKSSPTTVSSRPMPGLVLTPQ